MIRYLFGNFTFLSYILGRAFRKKGLGKICLTLNQVVMGIISSPLFNDASGSLGNIVIYKVKNQIRIRAKPLSHRDKKSSKQLTQRQKFKKCLQLYQFLDNAFLYSWRQKANDLVMNSCNLFIKENIHNISAEGEIADPAILKICTGPLSLPENLQTESETPGLILLRWDTQDIPTLQYDDILQIGVYGILDDIEQEAIVYLKEAKATREEGQCQFKIPPGQGMLHFYACFKSLYTNEYSDSAYLGSWEN